MAKAAVPEALFRIADRCVQVVGGIGVSGDTIVEPVRCGFLPSGGQTACTVCYRTRRLI